MIYTARQLQDLLASSSNNQVVLPYGARLTPLAQDWVRAKKVALGFSNIEPPKPVIKAIGQNAITAADNASGKILWWCEGACGAAKAAVAAQSKESPMSPIELPGDAKNLVPVIKQIAGAFKAGSAAQAIILVQTGATAMVLANRSPMIRAVLGTCMEAVNQGLSEIAANVLVIEYQYKTLSQIKNFIGRFARGGARTIDDQLQAQLKELAL